MVESIWFDQDKKQALVFTRMLEEMVKIQEYLNALISPLVFFVATPVRPRNYFSLSG